MSSVFILPLSLIFLPLFKKKPINTHDFFALSVNLDKDPSLTPEFIEELQVKHLLVRFPLSDIDKIDEYVNFIKTLKSKSILVNLIQDPHTLDHKVLLKEHFMLVFEKFSPYVQSFQIGSTINRSKWGFFSVNQYLKFYQIAYKLKTKSFPELKLLGPSVIDFEYHYVVHALFNFFRLKFDAISALLYVDRRGAPENTQMGMDLISKIHLLFAFATMSPKSSNEIYITETNWPLTGTAPYAPTSEHECIDTDTYANYMVRYYLLALCSNMVKAVYWHQLIAPGYGLIDNREGIIKKYPAFYAFKTMLQELQGAEIFSFVQHKEFYEIIAGHNEQTIQVLWCNDTNFELTFSKEVEITNRDGEVSISKKVLISGSPIYVKEGKTHA